MNNINADVTDEILSSPEPAITPEPTPAIESEAVEQVAAKANPQIATKEPRIISVSASTPQPKTV